MKFRQIIYSAVYQTLWGIAPIFIRKYLKKRALKAPSYLEHWGERFGEPIGNPVKNPIWIHAVSVGEMRASEPLIKALQELFPQAPLLITQMTPTGRKTASDLFNDAQIRYLPYDKKRYVEAFLREHTPLFGVLMETEIWPNLIHGCDQHHIPLFLANARLSEKSLKGYLKGKPLITPAVTKLSLVCAQTEADAIRLKQLGVQKLAVCGNTKYDIEIPQRAHVLADEFKRKIGGRSVVVCASTRKDEEALLLAGWQKQAYGQTLLVIVPRHPERFDEIFNLAKQMGFNTQKRSDEQDVLPNTNVWIGDSMGELFSYYLMADIAFVGGSLVDLGGQNILEPLQCAKPTLFGGSMFNFQQISEDALMAKAAIQVHSADEWAEKTVSLLGDTEEKESLTHNAEIFTQSFKGASQKIAQLIEQTVPQNKTPI